VPRLRVLAVVSSGRRGWCVSALLIVALAGLACQRTDGPETTVNLFYTELGTGAYTDATKLIRAGDGAVLPPAESERLVASWRAAYGDGGKIHVTSLRVVDTQKLQPSSLAGGGAADVRLLTLEVDGSSDTPCLTLPLRSVAIWVALINDKWYLVNNALASLGSTCRMQQ